MRGLYLLVSTMSRIKVGKGISSHERVFISVLLVVVFAQPGTFFFSNHKLPRQGLHDVLQSTLDELYASSGFPGITASLVMPDGTLLAVAAGYSDVELKQHMHPDDHMLAGSIGKTYVSAVMLELVAGKKARLDDKLQAYFGGETWYHRLPNAPDITIRSLLNHTSGIPNHVYDERFVAEIRKDPGRNWAPLDIVNTICDRPPVGRVGQKYLYSDTNYILIGMLIEKITQNSYYAELQKRILLPFNLDNTRPSDRRIIAGLVNGYTKAGDIYGLPAKVTSKGKDFLNPQVEWTGGGLVSNSMDLARWAHLLYGGHVLTPESLDQMLSGITAASETAIGSGVKYGLGVYEWDTRLGVAYGHQGDFPGYRSIMQYFPQYKTAIAMQFNTDNQDIVQDKPREFALDMITVAISIWSKH